MRRFIFFAIFTLIVVNLLVAETIALNPSDDMYSDAEHPGLLPVVTELWTANYVPAGHFERIMLRFELASYLEQNLISAELHLTRHFGCPVTGTTATNFYFIDQDWAEETWDHTQHIAYNSEISMPYVFNGNGGATITQYEIDVTEFVANWFEGNAINYGFVILAQDSQKWSKFYSKEFSNSGYRPQLVLELDDTGTTDDKLPQKSIAISNYPNPFNPETTINYDLPASGNVLLEIFNVRGQRINTLHNLWQKAGWHEVVWTGCNDSGIPVSSGVYHYQIRAGSKISFGSMQLIK